MTKRRANDGEGASPTPGRPHQDRGHRAMPDGPVLTSEAATPMARTLSPTSMTIQNEVYGHRPGDLSRRHPSRLSAPASAAGSGFEPGKQARHIESGVQVVHEQGVVQRPLRSAVADKEDGVIDAVTRQREGVGDDEAGSVVAGMAADQYPPPPLNRLHCQLARTTDRRDLLSGQRSIGNVHTQVVDAAARTVPLSRVQADH